MQVLDVRQRVLGEEYPHTLASTVSLSLARYGQGLLDEAELLEEVLDVCKRVFGPDHPNTQAAMSKLAEALSIHGSATSARF
jgi:hypothetical protein